MNHASALSCLRDLRLAAHATSQEPAWVWSTDGTRVLWANAVAVALFGAPNLTALRERRFSASDRPAAHVVRLAASLPENGAARLERLRGFGTSFFRLLTCTCSRLTLSDGTPGVAIVSTERAGAPMSLAERARRLLEGVDAAIAAFAADGSLLYATPTAAHRMAGASSWLAFEANALAAEALASGSSAGRTLVGPTSIARVGQPGEPVLIASFGTGLEAAHEGAPAIAIVPSPPMSPAASETPAAAPATEARCESGTDQAAGPDTSRAQTAAPAAREPSADADLEPAATLSVVPETTQETRATTAAPAAQAPSPPRAEDQPRPHPLRFVWQIDKDGRFTLSSDEFLRIIGSAATQAMGKSWNDINASLRLDPEGRVARAISTRDTWSGAIVSWPVEGVPHRLKVELSGLPIYDRQRNFIGYRGFGVCRDLETLTAAAYGRREPPAPEDAAAAPSEAQPAPAETEPEPPAREEEQPPAEREAPASEPPRQTIMFIGPAPNVVPFRVAAPSEPKTPHGLNAGERNAFTEIARQLSARLKNNDRPAAPPTEAGAPVVLRSAQPSGQADEHAKGAERAARGDDAPRPAGQAKEPASAALAGKAPAAPAPDARALIDRLPFGVLVYRFDAMLYANRTFLACVGYESLASFSEAGGIDSLFIETNGKATGEAGGQILTITTGKGDQVPVEGRLFSVPWESENALALVLIGPRQAEPAPPPLPREDPEQRARLRALEAELAETREALKATGDERNELLGKVGKEMRAPLTAIIGFVETMLSERYGPIGNERYRGFLTDIHYSGSRILALFDDLASLSKIDRGNAAPAGPSIKLNEVVQACVAQMQGEASRVRVLIRTSLGNALPDIVAEPDSARQVVLNLLTNSIRFAGAGGQVIVSTAAGSEDKVLLRLRDTGPGLSASDLAQLQAGPKAPASAEAADQQLTLAVARALLEANQASLSVTSKAGEGTMVEAAFVAAR